MTDYWLKGFPDPQRGEVCRQLLRRLFALATDVEIRYRLRGSAYLQGISNRTRSGGRNWSIAAIRTEMETHVAETAMLELQPDNIRNERSKQLYEQHQRQMSDLFDYILTSGVWNDSLYEAFLTMLLAPTIDTTDQQLMISAVTLSAMNSFDPYKWLLLADVYQRTTDEHVRQCAIVGCVFCLDSERMQLFPETSSRLEALLADNRCRTELTELQLQLYYCISAEDDTRKIQQEIMPELLRNNNYRITRNGIEEVEEDPMQDILDPEASERNIEHMEESVRKMISMQRAGSDIYFGGFSQMKRFPFFSSISNWFTPFYPQHPAISAIMTDGLGRKFLRAILKTGTFCDSDKYSFALAFEQTLSRMPDSLIKLLDSGEAQMIGTQWDEEEAEKPAYIRRMYLQNLYRFFRVFPNRAEFRNPFDTPDEYLFFANPILARTATMATAVRQAMAKQYTQVASFLYKHKRHADVLRLTEAYDGPLTPMLHLLYGNALLTQHPDSGLQAATAFRQALSPDPLVGKMSAARDGSDNDESNAATDDLREQALSGLARAEFRESHYDEALSCYSQLLELRPEKKSYQLNQSVCLMQLSRYEEALKVLYKLNYEHPGDDNVNRILAWALVGDGKCEQAAKIYNRLLADEATSADDDLLNYGYCLWTAGDAAGAATMLRQYAALQDHRSTTGNMPPQKRKKADMHHEFFVTEHQLLNRAGITDVEIRLMLDQIHSSSSFG